MRMELKCLSVVYQKVIKMITRIIPQIVLINDVAWHTVNHKKHKYLGDPINLIKILNDYNADEIIILRKKFKTNASSMNISKIIARISTCPIGIGGGIKSFEDGFQLFNEGYDKVILKKLVQKNPTDVVKLASTFGENAISYCINYYEKNQTLNSRETFIQRVCHEIKFAVELGIGEVILQNVTRSGFRLGLDFETHEAIRKEFKIPVLIAGGFNGEKEMIRAKQNGVSGIAGSTFFFVNEKNSTPLVRYIGGLDILPNLIKEEKNEQSGK